ncbi:hypothetical protein RJ640_026790 [Escallonia rubra]|uniref:non-specific serine/threonine protein kinase n=1 Tax=Escallonia rubra TaxID=112253 RepID=A0AA88QR49_9ASTE|nr:hypothetical protein RJ640_026790 [Escallonia rubra]
MSEHLRVMSNMIGKLRDAGHALTDEQQVRAVIRSLPASWANMKQILTHSENIKIFSVVSYHVILEAETRDADNTLTYVAQEGPRNANGKRGRQKSDFPSIGDASKNLDLYELEEVEPTLPSPSEGGELVPRPVIAEDSVSDLQPSGSIPDSGSTPQGPLGQQDSQLRRGVTAHIDEVVAVHCENTVALDFVNELKYHGKAKHIGLRYHFIRTLVAQGEVSMKHIPTGRMVADPLTKPIARDVFLSHIRNYADALHQAKNLMQLEAKVLCLILVLSQANKLLYAYITDFSTNTRNPYVALVSSFAKIVLHVHNLGSAGHGAAAVMNPMSVVVIDSHENQVRATKMTKGAGKSAALEWVVLVVHCLYNYLASSVWFCATCFTCLSNAIELTQKMLPEQLGRRFSLAEIQTATQDFDDALVIGQGGFGKVYKGMIDNGASTVAIKRLNSLSKQGAPEFWTEVEMLSKFRHCHLVSLIGYCDDSHEMVLVYEYMLHGTLDDHLHKLDKSGNAPLSWVQRLKICIGAARGLDYLHTGTSLQHRVIHRDVKSSNILLDENWAAKVSDFGLSKLGPANQSFSHVNTDVKGTLGYLDPEYFLTCQLTRKSDVYAFGVVLFEVLSGRPAVDRRLNEEQMDLTSWAKRSVKWKKIDQIIDPYLEEEQLNSKKIIKIANDAPNRDGDTVLEVPLSGQDVTPNLNSKRSSEIGNSSTSPKQNLTPKLKVFTVAELKSATGKPGLMVRKNSEGWVDRNTYAPSKAGMGMAITIECLDPNGLRFLRRGQFGHCLEDEKLFLVFEFMQNGSLESCLSKKGAKPLPWATRLKIATGAAQGLAFLHGTENQAMYFSFKASTISMDGDHNAKLFGFGLRFEDDIGFIDCSDHYQPSVWWSLLVAPEYRGDVRNLTSSSDVYGFGVVLLQILTGRRVFDYDLPFSTYNLVEWARPFLANEYKQKRIMDAGLKDECPSNGAFLVAELALLCVDPEPDNRPSMEEVVESLKGINAVKACPDEKSKACQGHNQKLVRCLSNAIEVGQRMLPEQLGRRFSLAEIQIATQDFDDALVIGQGGFGKVYKGTIDNGASTVAIKRLNSLSKQGAPEFWTEVEMLSKFRHCHLVSLIGYCDDSHEMVLVYEYMLHGTLDDHLHKLDKCGNAPLSWVQRLKICIGAARGLDYLHTGTSLQHRVIHRDVKSSNILLDENRAAKVSDFGLSKLGPANQSFSHVNTDVKGTLGYLDPEYFLTCQLTRKSDVYAFGLVLFEVLLRRPAVDPRLNEELVGLASWAKRCVKGKKVDQIIDPYLKEEQLSSKSLRKFVKIADQCLSRDPEERPTMGEVMVCLEFALKLQESASSSLVEEMTFTRKMWLFFLGTTGMTYVSDSKMIIKSGNKRESVNEDEDIFKEVPHSDQNVTPKLKAFTFAELESATGNSGLKVGRTFRGWVDKNTYAPSNAGIGIAIVVEGLKSDTLGGFNDGQCVSLHNMSDCDGSPSTSSSSSRRFSLADIQSATDNFADELVIGRGGFGKVYKGSITDGERMTVAVKRLNPRSRQGAREFRTEIEMLSRFRYPYLVSLIGYCDEQDEMILVYEYMPRGNFADHLHRSGKNYTAPLPWLLRLRICIGAARGLDYLHTGTSIQPDRAIHRDVKSSNILLDDNWDAKISDFGLSKLGPEDQAYSHVSTEVKGTFGYLDPEYYLTRRLTRKSDVYAFGVVMLEALCGRPAVDMSADEEQWGLAGWAQYCISERTVDEIIDPSVREEIKKDCLMEFVQIADECLHHFPRKRPTMAQVVVRLEFSVAMREGKDSSIVVKPAKMPLTLHEGEDSSDVVKPAKMSFTRKLQQYFSRGTSAEWKNLIDLGKNHGFLVLPPKRPLPVLVALIVDPLNFALPCYSLFFKDHYGLLEGNSFSNSILPDKDGGVSNKDGVVARELPSGGQTLTPSFKLFTFNELKIVTKNFNRKSCMLVKQMKLYLFDLVGTVSFSFGSFKNLRLLTSSNVGKNGGYHATEDATERTQTVNILPIAVPAIGVDELKEITDSFGKKALIGEGSCGIVYYGILKSGQAAAIKKFDSSEQPDDEYLAQVSMLSRLKHENVVELLGYSVDSGLRVLVYKYASNGSLHDILHGKKGVIGAQPGPVLSWSQRVKIAVAAAKGLEYLHEKVQPRIIHRDITSSSILLFDDDVAKIADFDLSNQASVAAARLHSPPRYHVPDFTRQLYSTRVLGNFGYCAPEYSLTGQPSSESDIYSFGVVLLELLTGRKPFDHTLPHRQQSLVTWATPKLSEDKLKQCVDPRLNGEYPPKAVAKMAAVAALCVQYEAVFRPNMSFVVKALQPLLNARSGPAQ